LQVRVLPGPPKKCDLSISTPEIPTKSRRTSAQIPSHLNGTCDKPACITVYLQVMPR
jgi:hypothetical protein